MKLFDFKKLKKISVILSLAMIMESLSPAGTIVYAAEGISAVSEAVSELVNEIAAGDTAEEAAAEEAVKETAEDEAVNEAVVKEEKPLADTEELLRDDYTGLVPVYANTAQTIKMDDDTPVIGYVSLNHASKEAEYFYATGSSLSPRASDSVRVPLRVVVLTGDDGKERAYDYTEGYCLSPDGYATKEQYVDDNDDGVDDNNGRKYITGDVFKSMNFTDPAYDQMFDDTDNEEIKSRYNPNKDYIEYRCETREDEIIVTERTVSENGIDILETQVKKSFYYLEPIYIGEVFDVTALDKDVFKSERMVSKVDSMLNVSIPETVVSDIDADYFSLLKQLRTIDFYEGNNFSANYIYNAFGHTISRDGYRYRTKDTSSKDGGGTANVLVDTHFSKTTVPATIVYCPPKYEGGTYKFWFGNEEGIQTEIAPEAFKNCVGLVGIEPVTPNTQVISSIGNNAFEGCTSLTSVKLFNMYFNLDSIGDYAFKDCTALEKIDFLCTENTVLGKGIFYNTSIAELNIPFGYNSMTGETFWGMESLKRINVVPGSRTDADAVNRYYTSIDGVLYRYDNPKEEPDIDDGITLVKYPAQCVTKAVKPGTDNEAKNKAFAVPYQVTGIDDYGFYGCRNLIYLYFSSTIMNIGEHCIADCDSLSEVYFYSGLWEFGLEPEEYASKNYFENCNKRLVVYAGDDTPIYKYAQANPQVSVKALYHIKNYTFSGVNLTGYEGEAGENTDIVIPNYYMAADGVLKTVTGINDHALANEDITSVYLLHDMKNVSETAFYLVADKVNIDSRSNINARNLQAIYVEDGNDNLTTDKGVLYSQVYNPKTKKYEIEKLLYYPAGSPMQDYTTLAGMDTLPEYAFWGAKNLRNLNIYDSIQEIGYDSDRKTTDEPLAFLGCLNLVKINIIPDKNTIATTIRYYSDNGVLYLWNPSEQIPEVLVYYPKGRREMDIDDTSHVSYVVADGCREIRDMKNCLYLNTVTFPKSVQTIDNEAFLGCNNLTGIIFKTTGVGEGISHIGEGAFARTALQELSLPSTIRVIGDNAFYDCNEIKSIRIEGNNLQLIGKEAFYRSTTTDGNMDLRTNSGGSLNSLVIIGTDTNNAGGNLTIGESAFAGSTALENVSISNMGRTTIGQYAFRECISMRTLDVTGSNIVKLGMRSFGSCRSLKSVNFKSCYALTEIPDFCFAGCAGDTDGLESVILPVNISSIGQSAFADCTFLDDLNFTELTGLRVIEAFAFTNTGFVVVRIPDGVETLGNSVFYGCPLLYTFYIPESVIFYDSDQVYTDNNKVGPFRGYNKSAYIYGIEDSDVDLYIQYMDSEGYDAPTFVGSDHLPEAIVDIQQTDVEIYDVGDYKPTLTAVVSSTDNLTDYSVVWLVKNDSICSLENFKFDGTDTSSCDVAGLSEGVTRVYCINRQSGSYDYCNIVVKNAALDVNPTESDNPADLTALFNLPKNIYINCKGSNRKSVLNATSNPPRKVYFKSADKRIASVNKKGIVTGKRMGVTTIIVYAGKDDTYVEEEVTVNVYKPVISLDAKKKKLFAQGEDSSFELSVKHEGVKEDVTWTSSNPAICSVEGDNEKAVVTVLKDTGKKKNVIITAECNGIKAKCKVNITPCKITLDVSSLTLYAGDKNKQTYQLKGKTTGKKKSSEIEYTSTDPAVVTVDKTGLVTAVAPGKAEIIAEANNCQAKCRVRVIASTIKLFKSGDSLNEVTSYTMNAKGDNTKQFMARAVGDKDVITYTSTDTSVFTVDSTGLVTAKKAGVAELVAEANGEEARCEINVIDNFVQLDYKEVTIYEGESITIMATEEGIDNTLKWETEDDSALYISSCDNTANIETTEYGGSGVATFVANKLDDKTKKKTVTIKVTSNGLTATCKITIKKG